MSTNSLVLVANRLPWLRDPDGGWKSSPGGLIGALHPIAHRRPTTWVGLSAAADGVTIHGDDSSGDGQLQDPWPCACGCVEVRVHSEAAESHYNGVCNAALWPTYHDAVIPSEYSGENWSNHEIVTRAFADAVTSHAAPGAVVWIHDYQLQLLPKPLRQQRPDLAIGFFLHIPFPPPEIFMRLPWRQAIVDGLRHAHVIGFQTAQCLGNFRRVLSMTADADLPWSPELQPRLVVAPVSIDTDRLAAAAGAQSTVIAAQQLRKQLGDPKVLLLGVDRLDYTKGLVQKVRAVQSLLADGSLDSSQVAFLQIASPTRVGNVMYRQEAERMSRAFGAAIGATSAAAHTPIRLITQAIEPDSLTHYFAAADAMLVTPLRDGMNLVAKEYVTVKSGLRNAGQLHTGALVLSEFAGAAYDLIDAYLVNPYSIDTLREGIMHAVHDPLIERQRRLDSLAATVANHTTFDWADGFLATLSKAAQRQVIELRPRTRRVA